MTATNATLATALAPVRRALLAAARADAQATRARAEADAQATVAAAAATARQIRDEARAQGTAYGAAAATAERNRVRRQARAIVLRAQRDGYEQLRAAAREAVVRLHAEPDHPALRRRMAAAVSRTLGADATLRDSTDGGVIGESRGRRVDFSLVAFADRAVDAVSGRMEAP